MESPKAVETAGARSPHLHFAHCTLRLHLALPKYLMYPSLPSPYRSTRFHKVGVILACSEDRFHTQNKTVKSTHRFE